MSQRALSTLRTHDDRDIPVAGVYTIDPMHTTVEFVGRHLMISKVRGRFPEVSGTITIDDEPERSHVELELEVATIDSGIADRDAHSSSTPRVSDHHLQVHQGRSRELGYLGR